MSGAKRVPASADAVQVHPIERLVKRVWLVGITFVRQHRCGRSRESVIADDVYLFIIFDVIVNVGVDIDRVTEGISPPVDV